MCMQMICLLSTQFLLTFAIAWHMLQRSVYVVIGLAQALSYPRLVHAYEPHQARQAESARHRFFLCAAADALLMVRQTRAAQEKLLYTMVYTMQHVCFVKQHAWHMLGASCILRAGICMTP